MSENETIKHWLQERAKLLKGMRENQAAFSPGYYKLEGAYNQIIITLRKLQELGLWDQEPAELPDRSFDAEEHFNEVKRPQGLKGLRGHIFDILNSDGPLTDEEVAERLSEQNIEHTPSGVRTRRSELVRMGHVRPTGYKRGTSKGSRAQVWCVAV